MQWQTIERRIFTLRIKHGVFPYHLALLQLEHDSSLQKVPQSTIIWCSKRTLWKMDVPQSVKASTPCQRNKVFLIVFILYAAVNWPNF
jgi:hypothetical protein